MTQDLIDIILSQPEIISAPPVLIDIGASGELHAKWKKIAKHSICIAFDADNREMGFTEKETDTFKKLIVFSRVVTDQSESEIDFYLTKSPYCSSALEPDTERLKVWSFAELFQVEKKIKLKAIHLTDALREAKIENIDWFKTDTQGTDLRLFKSLPEKIRNNVIVAEFEPGILDAYKGEDKLYEVIRYMDELGFFLSTMEVKGTQRINPKELSYFQGFQKKAIDKCLMKSPGWAELSYINSLKRGAFDRRAFLLTFLFACLENQYGFACEVADEGYGVTQDSFFLELKKKAIAEIKKNNRQWPRVMLKKAGNKIISYF
ncbi:MAG: hypothetical protein HOP08_07765 [Cyclobacteriaceae bacterium]|nr:hypothetical protein [Cyclobacteriaceae bacterium]